MWVVWDMWEWEIWGTWPVRWEGGDMWVWYSCEEEGEVTEHSKGEPGKN